MPAVLIIFGAIFMVAGLAAPHGIGALTTMAFGCASLNLGLNLILWRLDRVYLAYKFFILYFVIQPGFFFLLLGIFGSEVEKQLGPTTLTTGSPFSIFYSFCVVPIVGVLFAAYLDHRERQQHNMGMDFVGTELRPGSSPFVLRKMGPAMHTLLILSAFMCLMTWLWGPLNRVLDLPDLNVISIGLSAYTRALALMPLLAGLYWNRSRMVQLIWLVQLSVGLFLAVLTGARSYGFLPVAFYGLGYILQQSTTRKRLNATLAGLVGAVVLLLLAGFVQNLRDQVGRTSDVNNVDVQSIVTNLDNLLEQSKGQNKLMWEDAPSDAVWFGLTRVVDWTLVLGPNMSPDVAPYRGYDDFGDEILGLVSFQGLRILDNWTYDYISLPRIYGYNTMGVIDEKGNYGGMFAVPFNIMTDAWSRYGLLSSIVQLVATFTMLCWVEHMLMKYFLPRKAEYFALGRIIVVGTAVNAMVGNPLLLSFRTLVVSLCYALPSIGLLVYWLTGHLGRPGSPRPGPDHRADARRGGGPPRPMPSRPRPVSP